ncbi:hypothetical protein J7J90_04905 [Candidatus Micrarchaeota archaeon]|nr:hypothetical protein [Candidatus Micrarchaeota archaeon]
MRKTILFLITALTFFLFLGCCQLFSNEQPVQQNTTTVAPPANQNHTENTNNFTVNKTENVSPSINTTNTTAINETVYVSKWNEKIKVSPRYSPGVWSEAHDNCSKSEEVYDYIVCIGDYAAHHLDLTICLNLPTEQYIEQCIMKAGARLPSPTYCNQLSPEYINTSDDSYERRCWRSAKHHFE